ncbi:phosphoribosylglycinamide formyltransferase [Murdochiella massiliensis]|uniref:phosphoribosylglycinamide formyltransferase n=1 Tax=Murdochiella massiliensis TaxID=1673723 RepID=UPI00096AD049|nr:phosphoribosylglycinamide formyltransferase [Murdochiella massiliensis]MBY0584732.1 phosphoribosylglycinamide formyltransferase [Murdochiella sp. Marseille-P8839]
MTGKGSCVPVAVFVSGGGTNLQALLDAESAGKLAPAKISLVLSDQPDAYALERAKNANIPTAVFSAKDFPGNAWDEAVLDALKEADIALIALAGFLRVLSPRMIQAYPDRIVNIHPALLPSFGGRGYYGLHVHEAVLQHRQQITGATVHFVTAEADAGPILAQHAVSVHEDDTPETLQRRVMKQAEWRLLPAVVHALAVRLTRDLPKQAINVPLCAAEKAPFFANMGTAAQVNPHVCAQAGSQVGDDAPSLAPLVVGNPYPGRGIALAHGPHDERLVAYFIMGRSANSQNRIFVQRDGDLYTQAHDPALVEDPSLIIYRALSHTMYREKPVTVVTNGDQTDTILEGLSQGKSFDDALQSRRFEPDAPHFTPRISGLLGSDGMQLSIWKALNASGKQAGYYAFRYEKEPGFGRFLSTYVTNGNPLPSFQGEPMRFAWDGDAKTFTDNLWKALDAQNRIALYVEVQTANGFQIFQKSRFSEES